MLGKNINWINFQIYYSHLKNIYFLKERTRFRIKIKTEGTRIRVFRVSKGKYFSSDSTHKGAVDTFVRGFPLVKPLCPDTQVCPIVARSLTHTPHFPSVKNICHEKKLFSTFGPLFKNHICPLHTSIGNGIRFHPSPFRFRFSPDFSISKSHPPSLSFSLSLSNKYIYIITQVLFSFSLQFLLNSLTLFN